MEKLINNEHLSNIKFAADCAIKEPDSIYSQEFFMLLDETFGSKGDYESPTQAVAVAWLINRVNELEQRAEAAELGASVPVYQYESAIYNEENGDTDWYWDDCDKGFYDQYDPSRRRILFTRPAPAADLSELVPDEATDSQFDGLSISKARGWNACRAAILRNIEEANK